MTSGRLHVALCPSPELIAGSNWTDRFAMALESEREYFDLPVQWQIESLEGPGWVDRLRPYDAILWPPGPMGIRASSHLKEIIYFLQHQMGKLVVPNFESVWHFESKVAQSYLLRYHGISTPATDVSFSLSEARRRLESAEYPLVIKSSSGASSRGVKLVRSVTTAKWLAWKRLYSGRLWKIVRRLGRLDPKEKALYWQEYVPGNDGDLRVTVIGDSYIIAFRRRNRAGDFRASGSGNIDYDSPPPAEALSMCLDVSRRLAFDSMAYDLLWQADRWVISELSYTYVDRALFRAPGYYQPAADGGLVFRAGHYWPQQLWVRWLAERLRRQRHALSGAAPLRSQTSTL